MDYSKINGKDCGQRAAFEELICQLARREKPSSAGEFRRIEGSGGDGGIEAYWLLKDGSEIGYQAKYYLSAGKIDWPKIDDSVQQALKSHAGLQYYVIAIPCDLTDRSGAQGMGKKGWEHWDAHKIAWEKLCSDTGHTPVEFVPWTASDLTDKLMSTSAEGLRKYWFGDVEFSKRWFHDQVELAVRSLDERYHPEDHVEVGIERLFKVLVRDEEVLAELASGFSQITANSHLSSVVKNDAAPEILSGVRGVEAAAANVVGLQLGFNSNFWEQWPTSECATRLTIVSEAVHNLRRWIWDSEPRSTTGRRVGTSDSDYLLHKLERLSDALNSLSSMIEGRYFSAEQTRCALIEGRAGTGKSHTLGTIAQKAIADGRPTILILGQQINNQSLWGQITQRFGLGTIDTETFLQALSVAAEASGKRGLILIDAINEGAGAAVWRPELPALISRIGNYQNLTLVATCRTEYIPYLVSAKVRQGLQSFSVRGFETDEEQSRAAKIYLGRRGISQPDTPWLSAEFVNPLFLRSACTALARDGATQFPTGLRGTKAIFAFYLSSVARNLGVGRDGSDELTQPTIAATLAIAALMAKNRVDYVGLAEAGHIASEKFNQYPAPAHSSWFEVLQKNGIFRLDPPPHQVEADPFCPPEDIVRFSFQRLQDHLMASVLLEEVENPSRELDQGVLRFVHSKSSVAWQWAGLVEALSIQVPEKFGEELVDVLPGDIAVWARDYSISNAFLESLRWRAATAFTDRTLKIYNAFISSDDSYFFVLIELSASLNHPWNAEFLHKILSRKKLSTRDAFWTVRINDFHLHEGGTVRRLLDWCSHNQNDRTDPAVQLLCGVAVAWLTSASHREIRDRATKALSSLFLSNIQLYSALSEKFSSVDDLYILERLHAAAYGACCIDPSKSRLNLYSKTAYDYIFDQPSVPLSILLRDYALGIVELAISHASMHPTVDIHACRPPYKSKSVRLDVSELELTEIAKRAGGEEIKRSCTGSLNDFADQQIKPRVSSFFNVSLSLPMPYTQNEIYDRFETEIIAPHPDRVAVLSKIQELAFNPFRVLLTQQKAHPIPDNSEEVKQLEKALLDLLNPDEKPRFKNEFQGRFSGEIRRPTGLPLINVAAAQRWVAKRAYKHGWTQKLFPGDSSRRYGYSRDRPLSERVGAKYEWLALDELLCRLADTKWMADIGSDGSRQYRTVLDLSFHRDIDPTILTPSSGSKRCSINSAQIQLERVDEQDLCEWPFDSNPSSDIAKLVSRTDQDGHQWLVLYEHRSATDRYEDTEGREHGLRQREWRYLMPVIVRKNDRRQFVDYMDAQQSISVSTWSARESIDEGYLLEAPWRTTWDQETWTSQHFHGMGSLEVAFPCFSYTWESHLDGSMPQGASALLPSPWLAKGLSINPLPSDALTYADSIGACQLITGKSSDDGSHAYVRRDLLEAYLTTNGLECVWMFVAERGVWPNGNNNNAAWRRSEGIVWFEKGKPKLKTWKEDRRNGEAKRLPDELA